MEIDGRQLGGGPFVIAEVAQAHDGSLGTAHAYIDAAARAGADAVKFQAHLAHAESTPGEPWRVKFSPQDASRYDYWKRMEFSPEQWRGLALHAREAGMIFLASAFAIEAVEMLESIGMAAWKVGSGEITNGPLLDAMSATGKPVLLSSGMCSWKELDAAVERVRKGGSEAAVFQCTSSYPCPPERLGLNLIDEIRSRYDCPVGLSDHSATPYAGMAAATLGADLIEVHVVFSRECFGPDVSSSLTVDELARLVEGSRFIHRAMSHRIDKDENAEQLHHMRSLFTKSTVARVPLSKGHVLTRHDLAFKKPGTGLSPDAGIALVGRILRRDVAQDDQLSADDFE